MAMCRLINAEFFRDPERGLTKLFKRLKELGIDQAGPKTAEEPKTQKSENLKHKVLRRAELIRSRWKDIPGASKPSETKAKPQMQPEEEPEEEPEEDIEADTEPEHKTAA